MAKIKSSIPRQYYYYFPTWTKPYMNNNDNIRWLFFGGYKNKLPSVLTILLASRAIYSCIPLKAICYVPLCPPFRYVRKQILSFRCVRMRTKRNDWYVPLCPLFRYVRDGFSSFRCVRMRTKRNDWYVPLCPLFRYVRDGFSSFRCVRMRTKRNDWYVPLCPPFRYVRKQMLSFRCVRMCIYTHM